MKYAALIVIATVIVAAIWMTSTQGRVWRSDGNDASVLFEAGNRHFSSEAYDIDRAKEYFKEALKIDPEFPGVHYQLARVYFIESNFYDALLEINKEIELHPDFKRSYYVRGLIYGYTQKFSEAESDFKTFLEWKPDSWAAHNDLAWIYFQEGKFKEARDTARAGLKVSSDNPWLLNSLGVAQLNLGERKGAKEAFEKALEIINRMSPDAWGSAYPGNDPAIYAEGFTKMKESIEENLTLLSAKDAER